MKKTVLFLMILAMLAMLTVPVFAADSLSVSQNDGIAAVDFALSGVRADTLTGKPAGNQSLFP
jgi:hypothetical protein